MNAAPDNSTAPSPSRSQESGPLSVGHPIRSMTGFSRVTGFSGVTGTTSSQISFVLSLKSVNHRFLDLQFHLPTGMDAFEMQCRKLLKEHIHRGHVEVRLSVRRPEAETGLRYNPAAIREYLSAFREAAAEHGLIVEPDLNVAFRLPATWLAVADEAETDQTELAAAVASHLLPALESLNAMREQEGQALADELRKTLERLGGHVDELSQLRAGMQQAHMERLEQKMRELLDNSVPLDSDRIVQEAALMADRSDVEEEMARMRAHIDHFGQLLTAGGEVGKKLDFLLQEMTREANTTLSKTGGIATRSLRITELGLALKSEIEKAREQVQNIE